MTFEMLPAAAGVPPEQSPNSRDGGLQHVDHPYGVAKSGSGTRDLFPLPLGHRLPRVLVKGFNG